MAFQGGQPEKGDSILVVSLDNLGDLVFASALLDPLRDRFPAARIGVWCKAYASGLGPLLPNVTRVYASDPFWDRSPGGSKGSIRRFLSTRALVRRAQFDRAIIFSAPWRAAAAVASVGIPQRIGLARRRNERWLTDVLPAEDRTKPVLEEVARLLEPLGIQKSNLVYRLDASHLAEEQKIVRQVLGDDRFIALHPFAGSEKRCVSLDEWIRVADGLSSHRILWIGTTPELDRLRRRPGVQSQWIYSDAISSGSLTVVAVALSHARLFIGHDSGPMHIASALSVPTIGVFAPGEPHRTFPQGAAPWRIIARNTPNEISAKDILSEGTALL
ncbi:MAG TPA: glycosyltransferase family 9 protein [Gemmatimonadaceae bacterium]|nr:glycosyltransferase family 9 protein [Gemmatimonadaceae bacterium]